MPRYMVERTFPDGLAIPVNEQGAATCLMVVGNNEKDGVTWVHSYVTSSKGKTFCIYDGPSPEAVRSAARSLPAGLLILARTAGRRCTAGGPPRCSSDQRKSPVRTPAK